MANRLLPADGASYSNPVCNTVCRFLIFSDNFAASASKPFFIVLPKTSMDADNSNHTYDCPLGV